jgi:hypothetical protein
MEANEGNVAEYTGNNNPAAFNNAPAYSGENQYSGGSDWRANLPPDLQTSMQRFNNPESLANAYNEAMGLIGKKVENFSQRDWENYSRIRSQVDGIPMRPDQYQINLTPLNEGSINTFSPEDLEELKGLSHRMGLNGQQTQQLYGVLNELGNNFINSQEAAEKSYTTNNLNELAQDWGNAWQTKLRAVSNCVENLLPRITGVSADRIKREMTESGACNSALLMKVFAAMGELGLEGSSPGYGNIAPMDAGMRLSQLKSDPEWAGAIANKFHPMHQRAREELHALTTVKNGEY